MDTELRDITSRVHSSTTVFHRCRHSSIIEEEMDTKPPHLPSEVLDLIIDQTRIPLRSRAEVDEDEIELSDETLRTYLLVSRSFRRRVLPYIFGNLDFLIADNHPTGLLESFQALLESSIFPNPSEKLGWHITGVSLLFETFSDTRIRGHPYDSKSLICQQSVINLLRSLHQHAPKMSVLAMTIDSGVLVDWQTLSAAYQEAFHALVRLESVRFLKTLNIIHFPVTFLKGSHIQVLQITQDHQSPFDSDDPSMIFSSANPAEIDLPDPGLTMLATDHTFPIGAIPDISPSGSIFSGLKALRSDTRSLRHVRQTWTILSASPALETLNLEIAGEIEDPPPTFNLGNLPNLQLLTFNHIRTQDLSYDATGDESVGKILNFLEPAVPVENLEHLFMFLFFHEHDVQINFFHPAHRSGLSQWEQLDILLMGPKYPALKSVTISLVVNILITQRSTNFDNQVFLATTIQKIQEQFPRLSSTDKLLFNMTLESEVTNAMSFW